MPRVRVVVAALTLGACAGAHRNDPPATAPVPSVGHGELRAPETFAAIADRADRSRALFLELDRVLEHPRCVNCHPDGDSPHQGNEERLHDPPVERGPEGGGGVGMECAGCHQDRNQPLARVPGAPRWRLAPREMAWFGKSPHAICEQLKDPARNGHRTMAQLVEHSTHDELVGWGWQPGVDREHAPGSQARFGALVAAWADTGAECPPEGATLEVRP